MTKDGEFKLLKIQTCVLRVNMHCDGCTMKVKKLLQRIEGVYQVNIDAEQQKVTVSGSVDSATLIKKLARSGKHVELWSQKTNENPKSNSKICFKDEKNDKNQLAKQGILKGLEAFKNQQNFPNLIPEEDDFFDEVDVEGDDEVDELRFLREKANSLGFLRQQAIETANTGKKSTANPVNNVKINQIGNRNGGNKGNPTLGNSGNSGIDPNLIEALRLNNAQNRGSEVGTFLNLGGNSATSVNLGGHNGNNGANVFGNGSGGIGYGGFQNQIPSGVLSAGHNPYGMMMNANGGSYTAPLMMDLQSRGPMFPQPQMMYQRSPFVPPSTGFYCNDYDNYGPIPYNNHSCYTTNESDENSGSCSIM